MSSSLASDFFRSSVVVVRMFKKLFSLLAKLIRWIARKARGASAKKEQRKAEMQRVAAQQQAAERAAARQSTAPAAASARPTEASRPVESAQTKSLNLSQCIIPRAVDFNGGKKLRLERNDRRLMQALQEILGETYESNRADCIDFIESVRATANKTENIVAGDVITVNVDYDWELSEELGLKVTGTKFRLTVR